MMSKRPGHGIEQEQTTLLEGDMEEHNKTISNVHDNESSSIQYLITLCTLNMVMLLGWWANVGTISFAYATSRLHPSDCGIHLFAHDPSPWGGKNCTQHEDCGGALIGQCINANGTVGLTCVCPSSRGKPDCSYKRHATDLVSSLNIGLPFGGIGGIGNVILGNTSRGYAQLLLIGLGFTVFCTAGFLGTNEVGKKKGSEASAVRFWGILFWCAVSIYFLGLMWSILDGWWMKECKLHDGNGYALYEKETPGF